MIFYWQQRGFKGDHLIHKKALFRHLDLSWKHGFEWYDYTLVDTDVAINAMMWQMGRPFGHRILELRDAPHLRGQEGAR